MVSKHYIDLVYVCLKMKYSLYKAMIQIQISYNDSKIQKGLSCNELYNQMIYSMHRRLVSFDPNQFKNKTNCSLECDNNSATQTRYRLYQTRRTRTLNSLMLVCSAYFVVQCIFYVQKMIITGLITTRSVCKDLETPSTNFIFLETLSMMRLIPQLFKTAIT